MVLAAVLDCYSPPLGCVSDCSTVLHQNSLRIKALTQFKRLQILIGATPLSCT